MCEREREDGGRTLRYIILDTCTVLQWIAIIVKNGLSTAMALRLVQAAVMSEKLRKFIQVEIFVCVIGLSFEIEISKFAVRFSFEIKRILPFVPNGSMKLKGRIKYVIL